MLKIHFLNVGHGDCTFIELPSGNLSMLDINNSKTLPQADLEALAAHHGVSAWEVAFKTAEAKRWEQYYQSLLVGPVDYYREHFNGQPIFRYVQTHPDLDHMSGLYRFFVQERIPLLNFWDTDNTKECSDSDFDESSYDYLDWLAHRLLKSGRGPDENQHKVLKLTSGAKGDYYTPDGISVLSPTADLVQA